jgi:SAM-dependent methyltransferase
MSEDRTFIEHYPAGSRLRSRVYEAWLSLGLTRYLKRRRVKFMDQLLQGALSQAKTVIEVGCGSGRDYVKLTEGALPQIYGLDIFDAGLRQPNFTFVQGDLEAIPFPDRFFDVALSFGVLEHVEPMEKLSRGIKEITRVSKSYCIAVPCMATRLEPHHWEYRWQLKPPNSRQVNLNYLSDQAWRCFEGFDGANTARFDYIPGLITTLMIYKLPTQ